jgi:iron complex outermembrane recepter protein
VFQAKITKQPDAPNLVGTEPAGVSPLKMYAEYAVGAVPGLVLTGGVQYYDRQAVTDPATAYIPDYAVLDAGARHTTSLYGRETIFRLNLYNLANANYWAPAGAFAVTEGPPLTLFGSVEVRF